MKKIYLTAILLLLTHTAIYAQEMVSAPRQKVPEMNVDLPDETEETDLVGKGNIQLETQFLYNSFDTGSHAAIGQALLRYGLSKRFELRLLAEDGYNRDRYIEDAVQSTFPLAAGFKALLLKDHSWLPDLTLVAYLKLPVTSHTAEQAIYWSPLFLLAFQHKLGDKWKLEYNGGIQQEAYGPEWQWLANASLHYKLTDNLEAFGEYYAQFQQGEEPHHNAGGGLAYQLGYHFEFYAAGGSSINYSNPNYFLSGGVAVRL